MSEELSDDDVPLTELKKRRTRKKLQSKTNKEKTPTRNSKKNILSTSSRTKQKFVTPKIIDVRGGNVAGFSGNTNRIIMPKITHIQGAANLPDTPTVLSLGSDNQQKVLPDQAILEIVKALGLSVKDIEKHGGTVAISIPDNLIQDGVLDLTRWNQGKNDTGMEKIPQNLVRIATTPLPAPSTNDNFSSK